jgi:hypothetical protein
MYSTVHFIRGVGQRHAGINRPQLSDAGLHTSESDPVLLRAAGWSAQAKNKEKYSAEDDR